MGCLVYGLDFVSHSGNDPVITAHCVKKALQHDTCVITNVSEKRQKNFQSTRKAEEVVGSCLELQKSVSHSVSNSAACLSVYVCLSVCQG